MSLDRKRRKAYDWVILDIGGACMTNIIDYDLEEFVPIKRGRKPTMVPYEIANATAIMINDNARVPAKWLQGRKRRTYQLRNKRVTIFVRSDASKNWRPTNKWIEFSEGILVPQE